MLNNAPTNNKSILDWLEDKLALVNPDKVVWIDGSDEQIEALRAEACEALRERLKQTTGVRLKAGDRVSYAQVYGGASVTAVEGGSPIYSVANNCRDYVPTGCGRVFFNLLIDFAVRRNIHTGVFACICAELEKVLGKDGAARESWHEVYPEGKGEKQ